MILPDTITDSPIITAAAPTTNGNQSSGGSFLSGLLNTVQGLATTYGSVLETQIKAKAATGGYAQNANPYGYYNAPDGGQIIGGVSNQTLIIAGVVALGLVAFALTRR